MICTYFTLPSAGLLRQIDDDVLNPLLQELRRRTGMDWLLLRQIDCPRRAPDGASTKDLGYTLFRGLGKGEYQATEFPAPLGQVCVVVSREVMAAHLQGLCRKGHKGE